MAVIGSIVDCLMDKCYWVAIGRIGTSDTIESLQPSGNHTAYWSKGHGFVSACLRNHTKLHPKSKYCLQKDTHEKKKIHK